MTTIKTNFKTENPDDPDVRDPQHKHELGGTLGMTVGSGAVAGATAGGMGGPIGAVIGGAIGGVAGEKIAREVNPTAEEQYWEQNYHTRPYVKQGNNYTTYRPAYRAGIDAYNNNPDQRFEDLEPSLRNDWEIKRSGSKLEWNQARHAAQDSFSRLSDSKQ